jgi:flagellar hook-length control protein FliK
MAFFNSAALLNTGADAVKTASASQALQEPQNSGSDEFAQALRKQMQQSSKPVIPVSGKAEAPKATSADKTPPSAQPSNSNTVKNDGDTPKTSSSKQDEQKPAETAATNETEPVQTETDVLKDTSAVTETPQERKKRLLAELAANDQPPAGISPWMQTMIAMRPAAPSETKSKVELVNDATAEVAGAVTIGKQLLPETATTNTLPQTAEFMEKAPTTSLPAGPAVTTTAEDKGIDFKQVLIDTPQASAGKDAVLPETLVNAKLMADTSRETSAAAFAIKEGRGTETSAGLLNLASQPVAQALPNSAWLNAAGIAQTTQVAMSQMAVPFGNERWQTAMNQHVMNMVGSGDDVASLTLSPPDLGPIQVVLKVDNQSVNTSFITDNPLVRQALEDGMQDLRDRMQSQGLQLGQTFVGDGQQAQQHFEQQTARDGGQPAGVAEADGLATAQTAVKTAVARGLVDTFV